MSLENAAPGGVGQQRAIYVYKYNRANIANNLFACRTDLSPDGCTAYAIDFLGEGGAGACLAGNPCNRENRIGGNVFDRVVDDDVSLCPIRFRPQAIGNRDNVIADNIFRLGAGSSANANGICGETESLNLYDFNQKFGP